MQVTAVTAVVALALICGGVIWLLSRQWTQAARTGLDGFSALVTFIAVVLGGYWYLDRRPDAPKINLAIGGSAVPLGTRDVIVGIDLTVANVGLSSLSFDGEIIDVYVQQVTPLTPEMRARLYDADGAPRDAIDNNYLWAALRSLKYPYTARIEAGETDHYYFRTVLPCTPDLVVLLQARLPKRSRGLVGDFGPRPKNEKWIVQAFLEAGKACAVTKEAA